MNFKFPLGQNVYDDTDILNMVKTLLSEQFTMGERVSEFENAFAEYVGARYAVMVNSGSSANLLAFAALTNHKRQQRLYSGDEVLVPAVCWSTSVFPIIQHGLVPIFVDSDYKTLNIDLDDLERKINPKTKAIMLVHVLGNCTDMDRLRNIAKRYSLILVEDTCEALGSKYDNYYLGTFGSFGTYSFYYSHHITTIEGGMIVCGDPDEYEMLKCLRAHGWSRSFKDNEAIQNQYPDLDPRFTFVNLGYNVRPMEIQAAMGIRQLKQLKNKNLARMNNYGKIEHQLKNDPRNTFLTLPSSYHRSDVAWFGIALRLHPRINLRKYLDYLTSKSVENRPIITGNMVRQPVIRDLYPNLNPKDYPGAEMCHESGCFVGLSCSPMSNESIDELVDILLSY